MLTLQAESYRRFFHYIEQCGVGEDCNRENNEEGHGEKIEKINYNAHAHRCGDAGDERGNN